MRSTASAMLSRCCTLTVVITAMPGVDELQDVLPALVVRPRAGDVGMGELVDQRQLGPAGEHGVEVHLLELGSPVRHDLAGHDFEVPDQLGGPGPSVGLHESDDDVGAAVMAAPAFVEHGEGLAHAGHRAHVDAEPTGGADGVGLEDLGAISGNRVRSCDPLCLVAERAG